jgi:hypothetical protein
MVVGWQIGGVKSNESEKRSDENFKNKVSSQKEKALL